MVVVVGETVTEAPDKLPGFHVYVVAPEAVSVEDPPAQIVVGEAVVVTVGVGLTVMFTDAVPVQPFAAVPVTVYVVVLAGEILFQVEPAWLPGFQLYVDAPLADKLVVPPAQIDVLVAVAVTVGDGFTVMVRVAVAVQPFAAVPVTVYVVVVAGVTVTGDPVNDPGIHAYVDAPLAVIVEVEPEQIVAGVAVVVTVGVGFTVMVRVAVPVQPVEVPVTV